MADKEQTAQAVTSAPRYVDAPLITALVERLDKAVKALAQVEAMLQVKGEAEGEAEGEAMLQVKGEAEGEVVVQAKSEVEGKAAVQAVVQAESEVKGKGQTGGEAEESVGDESPVQVLAKSLEMTCIELRKAQRTDMKHSREFIDAGGLRVLAKLFALRAFKDTLAYAALDMLLATRPVMSGQYVVRAGFKETHASDAVQLTTALVAAAQARKWGLEGDFLQSFLKWGRNDDRSGSWFSCSLASLAACGVLTYSWAQARAVPDLPTWIAGTVSRCFADRANYPIYAEAQRVMFVALECLQNSLWSVPGWCSYGSRNAYTYLDLKTFPVLEAILHEPRYNTYEVKTTVVNALLNAEDYFCVRNYWQSGQSAASLSAVLATLAPSVARASALRIRLQPLLMHTEPRVADSVPIVGAPTKTATASASASASATASASASAKTRDDDQDAENAALHRRVAALEARCVQLEACFAQLGALGTHLGTHLGARLGMHLGTRLGTAENMRVTQEVEF